MDDGTDDTFLLLDHHQLNTNAREWIPSGGIGRHDNNKTAETSAGNFSFSSSLKVGKEFVPSGYNTSNSTMSTHKHNNARVTNDNGGTVVSTQSSSSLPINGVTELFPQHDGEPNLGVPWWASSYVGSATAPVTATTSSYNNRRSSLHSLGCADLLWNYYRNATLETLREMDPSDPLRKAVPTSFVNAYCLDKQQLSSSTGSRSTAAGTFGYPSHVFKVVSTHDGCVYCLRRFDNTKLSNRIVATVTERWTSINHPGICRLHRCFINQRAVFFVHDYCVGSSVQSITECYFTTAGTHTNNTISERLLWSYITQLVSILRYLHSRGLACRSLHPNHVLLVDGGNQRIRLTCCGVLDALEFEARKTIQELQQDDLVNLGRLILSIATGTKITSTTNISTLRSCEAFLLQTFSSDLHRLVLTLLHSTTSSSSSSSGGYVPPPISIFSVCSMVSNYVWDELEVAHTLNDCYSEELSKCYDNTRALRLLIKLGLINERPEFGMDTQWSETGDRYVIKLFRDYVFHQARADGTPVLDLGHIITSLNKLDAADPEKIVLVSRDGESLLVVSYADISRCVEEAYNELCSADTTNLNILGNHLRVGTSEVLAGLPSASTAMSTTTTNSSVAAGRVKSAEQFSHIHGSVYRGQNQW